MVDRPPTTKSAAQRFGFIFCPACNPKNLPSTEIPPELPCAWCWSEADKIHYRYVKPEVRKKWRREHGLPEDDEDEIQTAPQSRQALQNPPRLDYHDLPETDPAPPSQK